MQGSPFAPTTITANDIQKINDKIDMLQMTLLSKMDTLEKKIIPAVATSTSTVLPTTGISNVLPTTGISNVLPTPSVPTDLSSMFPKQGGSRRKKNRRSKRKVRK
jgi:hypothetical protein